MSEDEGNDIACAAPTPKEVELKPSAVNPKKLGKETAIL